MTKIRFDCISEWNIGSTGKSHSYSYMYTKQNTAPGLLHNTDVNAIIDVCKEVKPYLEVG
jgi:hypothetical protein